MLKTVIYIDAANIILSAKDSSFDLDTMRLIQHLRDSCRDAHVIYFTGNFRSKRNEFDILTQSGVEMVYKEIYNEARKQKANCDVEISHRITSDILNGTVENIILLSGDGDFACLYDFAYSKNIPVKAMAFDAASCSRMIKRRSFARVSYLSELGARIQK